eukprot:CAMPEP_0206179480 /NCGR_PEP_ID=MMETSP1474-20131121/67319_1 /ASSEMBLY_ACC=CAM_ASM_001110 /TAXON_ID=97495 /ORGANISM="Imantonia sp., Strain RCC918" /LENGTH=53 /DNA_ID=CAMNT_0053592719 /DNA_START=348 /DNA_END=509 /DNA_ORIENTATION=+
MVPCSPAPPSPRSSGMREGRGPGQRALNGLHAAASNVTVAQAALDAVREGKAA